MKLLLTELEVKQAIREFVAKHKNEIVTIPSITFEMFHVSSAGTVNFKAALVDIGETNNTEEYIVNQNQIRRTPKESTLTS